MGTFIKVLSRFASEQTDKIAERDRRLEQMEADLKKAISELKITQSEKDSLKKQVEAMRSSSQWSEDQAIFASGVAGIFTGSVPSLGSVIGGASLGLSMVGNQERTCRACGKKYTESPFVLSLGAPQCTDCRSKGFLPQTK